MAPNTQGLTRRITRGQGHSYELDGIRVPGVTTVLDVIAKPGLINWAGNETAAYAINNWDELSELDIAKRLKRLEKGRYETQKAAAARGTLVHDYAARLLAREQVDVPDEHTDIVDQAMAFLTDWEITELLVEVVVINREYAYMGTADLVAKVGNDPALWLFDWKTGRSGVFPETALQLAAYANAETMLIPPDDFERPFPHIERAAAVYLTSDRYEVIPANITEPMFEAFQVARELYDWTELDRTDVLGAPLPIPEPER